MTDLYELVTKTATNLNLMKDFEVGYSNPKKGIMIINLNGENFLIEATPIGNGELSKKMHEYAYKFK